MPRSKLDNIFFHCSTFLLFLGLALTIFSWMDFCVRACAEGHSYRLFGFPFEPIGIVYFVVALLIHLGSRRNRILSFLAGPIIASGVGAEMIFFFVQKVMIGTWCPVCLTIATCVFLVALFYLIEFFKKLRLSLKEGNKEDIMKRFGKGIFSTVVLIATVFIVAFSITKPNTLEALERSIKQNIALGNMSSPIEVYVFTDWQCSACRRLEPKLMKMAPAIMKKAKMIFVDHVIHPETLNFIPYNISFELNDKDHYLEIREIMTELSLKTKTPTDQEVEAAVAPLGVKYKQLNYADIAVAMKYFKRLSTQFGIKITPSVIVLNNQTKKGKKLIGNEEISQKNIMQAMKTVSKK